MIIVFDTNIWYSQLGLKSPSAAAARFYLRQRNARVAIPEVVRLEVTQNLTKRLLQHIESIRSEYRQLLTAFGKLREVVLPSDAEVHARIEELFASLGVEVIDVPFSLESARSSFLKTIKRLPPSATNQQFKDGVLWADCLTMMQADDVVLVTDDRAFYEEQKPSNGLARNLADEARASPNRIRVLSSLSELLDTVREPIPIDADLLQKAFLDHYQDSVFGTLERAGFELHGRTHARLEPFATENPSALFVKFEMTFDCADTTSDCRTAGALHLAGDCSFDARTHEFSDIRNFGEHLQFHDPDGTLTERRNHVLFADFAVMGHRVVTDVTRFPLGEQ